jgi:hypothetical protein
VDGASVVKQDLDAAQSIWRDDSFVGNCGVKRERLKWEAMADQPLDARQAPSVDGGQQDEVVKRAAMLDEKLEEVKMTYTAHLLV